MANSKDTIEKTVLNKLFLLMFGFICGFVFSINIKYPFETIELQRAVDICLPVNSTVDKIKIGITGKIYTVTCKNSITYQLHN